MKCLRFSLFICVIYLLLPLHYAGAVLIDVPTPYGLITLPVSHAGPTGQLQEPDPPSDSGFRPPLILAAPLPTGSGARALGQAGAFTAVADDATAASWNPAGLTQLESPEFSFVYRFSAREDKHESTNADLEVGTDRYTSSELNYLSGVYPFLLNDRNVVVSLNYQEAYDFTHHFTANYHGNGQQDVHTTINQTFYESTTNFFTEGSQRLTIITDVMTDAESQIDQVLNSSLLSGVDFRQSGTIDAISPALAFELNPRFSLGISVNIYTDGASRGNPIESTLTADYEGTSDSVAEITDTRDSTVIFNWTREQDSGTPQNPIVTTTYGAQTNAISDVETNPQNDSFEVEGHYIESNTTEDFYGVNATLGALWVASDQLTLGATIDLPWTGRGEQTKRVEYQLSAFDSNRVEVVNSLFQETQYRDVEYTFPLYWSVGGLWRWSDRLYSSMDLSRTHWSDYSYKADGEQRINPLNGEPHSSSALDDCWSIRLGGEYLHLLSWTEIPLRGGLFWEQRPATDSPDQYWGFSLGSGISLGKEPGQLIFDIAYIYERGENVMGAQLPDQIVYSDVNKHQIFCSIIGHF